MSVIGKVLTGMENMNGAPKCELCGEPMPEGEAMFKFHGYSSPCPKLSLQKQTQDQELHYPKGYCLDPDGKMSVPAEKAEDYNFGYEIGFREAWEIMNSALQSKTRPKPHSPTGLGSEG